MQLLAKLKKKTEYVGLRATLNFRKYAMVHRVYKAFDVCSG